MDYPIGLPNGRLEVNLLHPESKRRFATAELYITCYGGPPTRHDGEFDVKLRVMWDEDDIDPEDG